MFMSENENTAIQQRLIPKNFLRSDIYCKGLPIQFDGIYIPEQSKHPFLDQDQHPTR
jgi:hypothetical protein